MTPSHPLRKCCVMLEKRRSQHIRYRVSTWKVGGLTPPLNIPPRTTATTLPLPERIEVETRVGSVARLEGDRELYTQMRSVLEKAVGDPAALATV